VRRLSSPLVTAPAPPSRGFDPEAEQEVDFARYVRLLAVRWWLLAAGVVAGAVIGYLISLGGTQVYSAKATLYLGQPLTPGGNSSVTTLQTNPAAVGQIIHSQQVLNFVAAKCKAKESEFSKGISSASAGGASSGTTTKTAVNPLVSISVQTRRARLAECAANALATEAVNRLGVYPKAKIANLQAEIAADKKAIASIQQATADPTVSTTDKLIVGTTLRTYQVDENTALQLLTTATKVESPSIVTGAAAQKITARSRRNTVVIAALIGLILGALAALLWDRAAALLRT
jgi:capsular polysaccharide biosynthesis protein